jgi:hypothetical protein
MHIGSGWTQLTSTRANGERLALSARVTANVYDHLKVYRGSINPLGPIAMEVRTASDVTRFIVS